MSIPAMSLRNILRGAMTMLRPDSLFQIFGIILFLMVSICVISFTSKFIFGFGKIQAVSLAQHIYDPDRMANMSYVCPFTTNAYQIPYNETTCFNKTIHYWYIPWVHFNVWRDFSKMNEEKKRLKEAETKAFEPEGTNETKLENATEEVPLSSETPSNRKDREEPSKVVCTILAALLIISSIIAFCEVFRDKCLAKVKSNQRFSFGEVASTDHVTPEVQRQEAFQSTAKVTQTLVHQSSLDRAFSRFGSEVKPPFLRRSSVPAHMMSTISSAAMSGDLSGYGNPSDSPETRRKSRHFIRRH